MSHGQPSRCNSYHRPSVLWRGWSVQDCRAVVTGRAAGLTALPVDQLIDTFVRQLNTPSPDCNLQIRMSNFFNFQTNLYNRESDNKSLTANESFSSISILEPPTWNKAGQISHCSLPFRMDLNHTCNLHLSTPPPQSRPCWLDIPWAQF